MQVKHKNDLQKPMVKKFILGQISTLQYYEIKFNKTLQKWILIKECVHQWPECIGGINFPCCQLSWTPKWEARTRNGLRKTLVPAHLKTLENLQQQLISQESQICSNRFRSREWAGHSICSKLWPSARYTTTTALWEYTLLSIWMQSLAITQEHEWPYRWKISSQFLSPIWVSPWSTYSLV